MRDLAIDLMTRQSYDRLIAIAKGEEPPIGPVPEPEAPEPEAPEARAEEPAAAAAEQAPEQLPEE